MSEDPQGLSYRSAGVDIDAAENALREIGRMARQTHGPEVIGGVGHFGGLFHLSARRDTVLVSTTDSVGTKVLLASLLDRHRGIGIDLVNHCVNDLLATGARPLFFLDYYATPSLSEANLLAIVDGISEACTAAGCALVGGETAELPGVYREDAYDLAGFMVGAVTADALVTGEAIQSGDKLVGLPSAGLHTNGFTLARAALGLNGEPAEVQRLLATVPDWAEASLGELLLAPHRSYLPSVAPLLERRLVRGMAHVTGGGLVGNVERVVPAGMVAEIDVTTWEVPPLFLLIQRSGRVPAEEMFRVFNMGIGFVLIVRPEDTGKVQGALPEARIIGEVVAGAGNGRARLRRLEDRRGPV